MGGGGSGATAFPAPPIAQQQQTPAGLLIAADVVCLADLDPYFSLVTANQCLAQDLVHGITTATGSLFYDGSWGFDVRQQLNGPITPEGLAQLSSQIQWQWQLDERVAGATALLTWFPDTSTLDIQGAVVPVTGQSFQFVLLVTAVTLQLLLVS